MNRNDLYNSFNEIDDDILERSETASRNKMKPVWIKWGAIAACLCLVVAGALTIPNLQIVPSHGQGNMSNPANIFVVKAYALGEMEDGTIKLIEADLVNQPDVWGGHFDNGSFYVSVGLRYEGNNIESVDFITEDGFFAKQYIDELTMGENVFKMYVGADNKLVMYGTEFDIVGNMVTLTDETITDDLLLFWGTHAAEIDAVPQNIEINAIATFYDGQTQEVPISIDLSGTGVYSFTISEEDMQRAMERADYYKNLPLEECELIEGSVKTVTEVYEIKLGSSTSWVEIRDDMAFDETGIYRVGTRGDGSEIYIPVIKRDANGVYTGMIYRVPDNLRYNPE